MSLAPARERWPRHCTNDQEKEKERKRKLKIVNLPQSVDLNSRMPAQSQKNSAKMLNQPAPKRREKESVVGARERDKGTRKKCFRFPRSWLLRARAVWLLGLKGESLSVSFVCLSELCQVWLTCYFRDFLLLLLLYVHITFFSGHWTFVIVRVNGANLLHARRRGQMKWHKNNETESFFFMKRCYFLRTDSSNESGFSKFCATLPIM